MIQDYHENIPSEDCMQSYIQILKTDPFKDISRVAYEVRKRTLIYLETENGCPERSI